MSRKLTREETERIANTIGPGLGCLSRLVARMNRQGFAPDDEALQLAHEEQDRMQRLFVRLHSVVRSGASGALTRAIIAPPLDYHRPNGILNSGCTGRLPSAGRTEST
jgi:hypothetical protein